MLNFCDNYSLIVWKNSQVKPCGPELFLEESLGFPNSISLLFNSSIFIFCFLLHQLWQCISRNLCVASILSNKLTSSISQCYLKILFISTRLIVMSPPFIIDFSILHFFLSQSSYRLISLVDVYKELIFWLFSNILLLNTFILDFIFLVSACFDISFLCFS